MRHRFEVTLHVSGLSVPVDGKDRAKGFYAIRWTVAESPEDAVVKAVNALKAEEHFRFLVQTTEEDLGESSQISIDLESVSLLSWMKSLFTRHPCSFIFYQDKDEK